MFYFELYRDIFLFIVLFIFQLCKVYFNYSFVGLLGVEATLLRYDSCLYLSSNQIYIITCVVRFLPAYKKQLKQPSSQEIVQ